MVDQPRLAISDTDGDAEIDSLRAKIEAKNIADTLKEEELTKISEQVLSGFNYDLESRKEWDKAAKNWTKLALQVQEQKTYPWVGASNVKYPLLSTAAMQFNARAYPSLVPSGNKLVKATVIGKDKTGEKLAKAERISTYMSYQFKAEMDSWE